MFIIEKNIEEQTCLFDKILLKNKQTAAIMLTHLYSFDNKDNELISRWAVCFVIANKKKDINKWKLGEKDFDSIVTGKGSLEGLIWAKNKLIDAESFLKDNFSLAKHEIIIGWADNRRRDVYEKQLSKIGYEFTHQFGWKCLLKKCY